MDSILDIYSDQILIEGIKWMSVLSVSLIIYFKSLDEISNLESALWATSVLILGTYHIGIGALLLAMFFTRIALLKD